MGCIERVEAGDARGVAVWRYSRFGRDRTGNALNLARLQQAGGELESATEPVDASTAIGRFQRGMILEFGAFESDRAGEQWKETHDHRKYKLGLPAQGRKRFGYTWHRRWNPRTETLQKERYEPDERAGRAIADCYRAYVNGDADTDGHTGFGVLCARLNAAGHLTTQDTLWATETLSRYMDSGFAAGLLHVHSPDCRCRKTDGTCRNKVYIQGAHTELIDYDLWEAYLRRRKEVAATAPRSRNGIYDLSGLPRCGGCRKGTSLNAAEQAHGPAITGYAYRCSARAKRGPLACDGVWIPRARVEAAARAWLAREHAAGIDAAQATDATPARSIADAQADAATARARLQAEVDKQRAALARLRADHAANPDDYGPGEYDDAANVIRTARDRAQAALDAVPVVEEIPARADLRPLIAGLLREWDTLGTRARNGIYRQLLRRIALVRHGPGAENVEIQMHPTWEPDPWAPIST
jgi:site-specific DNA recombinase